MLPGALCSLILADMGAEVIKIEEPRYGDYNRSFLPKYNGESGSFMLLNRNKKSVTLNLKSEDGKAALLRMVKKSDVLLEGYRPGVMERLGLSYDRLKKENIKLVYCAISGFGQDGPKKLEPGHDLNYMALTGALQLFGKAGEHPIVPGLPISDVGGGSLPAAIGILSALISRQKSGEGQFVDIAMTDGIMSWFQYHAADYFFDNIDPKGGERPFNGQAPCYNIYECSDGKLISIGIVEEHFWERFCKLLGLSEFIANQWPDGKEAILQKERIAEVLKTKSRQVWVDDLLAADIPVAPVNNFKEAFAEPQLQHREMCQYSEHPIAGRIPQLGFPIKLSSTPCKISQSSPTLGQHTDTFLKEHGYSSEDIANLRARDVI